MNVKDEPFEVLHMYPGYALGGIIKKGELLFPILSDRKKDLIRRIEDLEKKIAIYDKDFRDGSDLKKNQHEYNALKYYTNDFHKQINSIDEKIIELYNENNKFFSVEEMLPLDRSCVKIEQINSSFFSERMRRLLVRKQDVSKQDISSDSSKSIKKKSKNKKNDSIITSKQKYIAKIINDFISELLSQDANSSCLPQNSVSNLIENIDNLLNVEQEVFLIGSFITLSRVRTIDPIKLKGQVSEELKKNCKNYYVLTEAVLGAVFIGYGQYISASSRDKDLADNTAMANFSLFSFTSQGAIPKVSLSFQSNNLASIYTSWKEQLQKDNTGFPIRFKFRELHDILLENNNTNLENAS